MRATSVIGLRLGSPFRVVLRLDLGEFQSDTYLHDVTTPMWPAMFVYRGALSFDEFDHHAVRI